MESVIPTLYLYSRVSTAKQTDEMKFGLDRQQESEKVDETIERFSSMPVITISDAGLSAYKKEHLDKGNLGKFVDLYNQGKIHKDSILAMEKLDRFSRLGLTEGMNIATGLLQFGLKIYTWEDKELYTRNNLYQMFKMGMKLDGAADYSKNLSINVVGSTLERLKAFQEGKVNEEGQPIAVNGVGSHAWWIDTSSGYVKPHEYYWPIAKEIVGWILKGLGHQKIREKLNEADYPPPRKKEHWGTNLVTRFHLDDKILGTRELTLDGNKYVLRNYYPPLVSITEFEKIKEIKKRNRSGRNGKKRNAGLFVGFKKLRCGKCGRTINTFISKSGEPNETMRYRCAGKYDEKIHCDATTVDGKFFETALIRLVGTVISEPPKVDQSHILADLDARLKSTETDLNDYSKLIKQANSASRLLMMEELNNIGEEKLKIEQEIQSIKNVPVSDPISINKIESSVIDYTQTESRIKWREQFYSHIKAIKVNLSNGFIDIHVELYNGNTVQSCLIKNKYLIHYDDTYFNSYHQSNESGGANAYDAANNWVGTDKLGNEIKLLDIDEHFIEHSNKILPSIHAVIQNGLKDESLFLQRDIAIPKLRHKLKSYADFFKKMKRNAA